MFSQDRVGRTQIVNVNKKVNVSEYVLSPSNHKFAPSITNKGKPPGVLVNIKDSQSEPWSSDMGSIPGFT
jgi:hypothetical protein